MLLVFCVYHKRLALASTFVQYDKVKNPYKHNFPNTRQFQLTAKSYNSCGRAASAFVSCSRRVALGRAGRNNVFRTSSPFLFYIEPNKKPQSEFSRRVNLEDIGCVSITDAKSSGGGRASDVQKERVIGSGGNVIRWSHHHHQHHQLHLFVHLPCACLQETMQPSTVPQEH